MHMALWVRGCPYRECVGWVSECARCHARKICKAQRLPAALVRAWQGEGGGGCNSSSQGMPSSSYRDMPGEPQDRGTRALWGVGSGPGLCFTRSYV